MTYHFGHGSLPSDGLFQLKQTQTDLRGAAAAVQCLSPRPQPGRDLALQAGSDRRDDEDEGFRPEGRTVDLGGGKRGSPDHVHGVLLPRRRGERSESHHLGRVPERLLQVAPLDVALQVGQAQHGQVQRVRGDARQARPLLLCPHDPVVVRVGVVLVVLQVVAREVGIRYCVGLRGGGGGRKRRKTSEPRGA